MCLKTDTMLLQYILHQFQYFITTYLCKVEIYQQVFQSNSFNGEDLMVLFNWGWPRLINNLFFFFFSIWVFFHGHSRFTGQQGKGEATSLTPLYHFDPLHRHLDISRAITPESSPLHIASSWTRTGNLWFPGTSR